MSRFIRQTLADADTLVISVDVSNLRNHRSLMRRMQEAFELPAYFNGGGDSLNDCLRDLGWLPQRHIRITFTGLADLQRHDARLSAYLMESLELWRDYWQHSPQADKIVRIALET
ncbi:barstar family protein [Eikenella sp. S3360]|uniref:Barstar family protein n=1 Tax=Eikenella glucosivorans TaxID=2766967 RepID=A0ABS0N7J5_9NEIS|nr:barstar family protein [Eikenella glucosivorans]MBH5328265.1 barstar family protein [Eikenella glucosivorans]